jgi:peroxiredoxin Q/BCP
MRSWLGLGLALACGTIGVCGASQAADLKPGDPAPEFSLQGSDGKTYKLADLKGKTVVVAWFPKAFTGGCTKECKALKEQGDAVRQYNVAYFTASCDAPDENKKFAESLELDYPILSDPGKATAAAYGVLNESKERSLRWTFFIGPDGKIQHIEKKVGVESHGKDVAAKLAELGAAKKK